MGELEEAAKAKLIDIRCDGGSSSMPELMSTPMVRCYQAGRPVIIFPVDLFDHGQVGIEALAVIHNLCSQIAK